VTSIVVTHQIRDAFYIAEHVAERTATGITIKDADQETTARPRFLVLHDGAIQFTGTASELLASEDPFLKEFLYRTLPPW
jgi:ABC-type transporter Mla maintaining outer membrane lipid asymmetry ATPase subunit MlaF